MRRRPPLDGPAVPRTTLVVAVRNEPGTLLAVLRVIAERGLNMRKLESRPSRERAWEYVFWIDLDGDAADPGMAAALEGARGHDDDAGPRQLPERRRLRPATWIAPTGAATRTESPARSRWRTPASGAASAFGSRQNGHALVGSGAAP